MRPLRHQGKVGVLRTSQGVTLLEEGSAVFARDLEDSINFSFAVFDLREQPLERGCTRDYCMRADSDPTPGVLLEGFAESLFSSYLCDDGHINDPSPT